MRRKLASIQQITKIEPIQNAERIERATVLGWQTVIRKGEFAEGDKVIFIEVDSLVPKMPQTEFLQKDPSMEFPIRLHTQKLRGCLSQGLALPLQGFDLPNTDIGTDVTDLLGITKHEYAISPDMIGTIADSFPSHIISGTELMRLQTCPDILIEKADTIVYVTEKCDGFSFTTFWNKEVGELWVCSSVRLVDDGRNPYWKVAQELDLATKLCDMDIGIQGELVGPGIRKNKLGLEQLSLRVFNIWDLVQKRRLSLAESLMAVMALDLTFVPIIDVCIKIGSRSLEEWLEAAQGTYPGTKNPREGIVVKSLAYDYCETLYDDTCFKVLNNVHLLKEK